MDKEIYINHPTFGLLYRICVLEENRDIFTTLYAQRLFFLVAVTSNKTGFEQITRADAKLLIENRLRHLRRVGDNQGYLDLQKLYQRTFQ